MSSSTLHPLSKSTSRKEMTSISNLESLPAEILEKIFGCLSQLCGFQRSIYITDHLPISSDRREMAELDLFACLLTSHRIYRSSIRAMYSNATISRLENLRKFINTITESRELGGFVRYIDLSGIQDSIPLSMHQELWPLLPSLVGAKHTERSKPENRTVIQMKESVDDGSWEALSNLVHLNLGFPNSDRRKIPEIGAPGFQNFRRLKVLTLSNSTMSDHTLETISSSARLTSLRISVGMNLVPSQLARLLVSHPSLKDSLISLHIEGDDDYMHLQNTTGILASVPSSVRSLDLSHWQMSADHIPRLGELCARLEELRIGHNLDMSDLEEIVFDPRWSFEPLDAQAFLRSLENENSHIWPILRAANRCKLQQRINSVCWADDKAQPALISPLRFLGISSIPEKQQRCLEQSLLLAKHLTRLEIIETSVSNHGNVITEQGWRRENNMREAWIMRES